MERKKQGGSPAGMASVVSDGRKSKEEKYGAKKAREPCRTAAATITEMEHFFFFSSSSCCVQEHKVKPSTSSSPAPYLPKHSMKEKEASSCSWWRLSFFLKTYKYKKTPLTYKRTPFPHLISPTLDLQITISNLASKVEKLPHVASSGFGFY